MDLRHIDTIPYIKNIQIIPPRNVLIPKGLVQLILSTSSDTFIMQLANGKSIPLYFREKQDEINLKEIFSKGYSHFGYVTNSTGKSALLDMSFFAGKVRNVDSLEISISPELSFLVQKNLNVNTFCSKLPELCNLEFNGTKYFIVQGYHNFFESEDEDDEIEDDDELKVQSLNKGFTVYYDFQDKLYRITIEIRNLNDKNNSKFLYAKSISQVKNDKPRHGFQLFKGSLTFSNQKKALTEINQANLKSLIESSGSYLAAWKEYTEARGNRLLNIARKIGEQRYTLEHKAGSCKVYLHGSNFAPDDLKLIDEVSFRKSDEEQPDFLKYPTYSFFTLFNKERALRKKERNNPAHEGTKSTAVRCMVESCGENWIEINTKNLERNQIIPESGIMTVSDQGMRIQITRQNLAWEKIALGRAGISYLGNLLEGDFNAIEAKRGPYPPKISPRIYKKIFNNPPTEKQREAIEIALRTPDIALIQGPPGTGKTTVITAILEILNEMQDKREASCAGKVLTTAYQHDAVENMIERIRINSVPTWKFGKRKDEQKNYNDHIDQWCKEIIDNIRKENPVLQLSSQNTTIHGYIKDYVNNPSKDNRVKLLDYMKTLPISKELIQQVVQLKGIRTAYHYKDATSEDLIKRIYALRTTSKSFQDDGAIRIYVLYQFLNKTGFLLDATNAHIKESLEKWMNIEAPNEKDFKEILTLKETLLSHFKQPPLYVKEDKDPAIIQLCADVIKNLKNNDSALDKKDLIMADWLRALQAGSTALAKSIKNCNFVYAATSQQAQGPDIIKQKRVLGSNTYTEFSYDTVIVDEAARAAPPDLLIPMCLAAKRIILVGDHRQLPQMVDDDVCEEVKTLALRKEDGKEFNYEDAFKTSLFEILFSKLRDLQEKDSIKRVITLDQQFRTHPVLGNFCSKSFYECHDKKEGYTSPRAAEQFSHNLPGIENKAAIWVDIPTKLGGEKKIGTSWTREQEADCIVEMLCTFIKHQNNESAEKKIKSYGVISFYKGQCNLIEEKINRLKHEPEYKRLFGSIKLKVGSVDAFQGMEFDVVFLSVVRSNTKDLYGFLTSPNRMCVSMSRQKKALIVVGNSKFVCTENAQKPGAIKPLYDFYNLCCSDKQYGEVVQWQEK